MKEIIKIPFIKNIQIRDFKIIKKANLEFKEGLNLIVGKNATGKTTVINFLVEQSGLNLMAMGDKTLFWIKQEIEKDSVTLVEGLFEILDGDKLTSAIELFSKSDRNFIVTINLSTYAKIKDKITANIINTEDFELND